MYNVSISFGGPAPQQYAGTAVGVMVTDAATGEPVTGLAKSQFLVYVWDGGAGAEGLYINRATSYFQEVAATVATLPGLYIMSANWSTGSQGSNPIAVSVMAGPSFQLPGETPDVRGVGVGTYISLG